MNELEKAVNNICGVHPDWSRLECFRIGFKEGAQWQSKQSPWIKTSEKLPTPTIEIVDDEEYGSVFVVGRTSKWKTPQLCCYYGYNGHYRWENGIVPEYWMPIPE